MKLTGFRLFAAFSLLWAATGNAAVRPQYGGTLHLVMRAAPSSLDPADLDAADWAGSRNINALLFDTLIALDARGVPQPALAISWQAEPGDQRWQFILRRGVTFADGSPLTSDAVAASVRKQNPAWNVVANGNVVVIQRDSPDPNLPAELALPRNAIAKRENGKAIGTGPFIVGQWDPGKKLSLMAREDCWNGRAFVDSLQIEMGKNSRDEMIALDLGQAQLAEVAPDQVRRAVAEGNRVLTSSPMELLVLAFSSARQSAADAKQREALALCIDRGLLNNIVYQGAGEPTGGLLPNWITGYGFFFSVDGNMTQAQQLRAEIPHADVWTLGFDPNDQESALVAERIVLHAQDAGLRLRPTQSGSPDIRLVRIPIGSLDAHVALDEMASVLRLPPPRFATQSAGDLYAAETAMLGSYSLIPLLYLRTAYAVSSDVRQWNQRHDGIWDLPNTWLAAGKP